MPPKDFTRFEDSERQLQSKTITLGWQKRALNSRLHQGVADLSAFLNNFRELPSLFWPPFFLRSFFHARFACSRSNACCLAVLQMSPCWTRCRG